MGKLRALNILHFLNTDITAAGASAAPIAATITVLKSFWEKMRIIFY